jgi:hypothetical protein
MNIFKWLNGYEIINAENALKVDLASSFLTMAQKMPSSRLTALLLVVIFYQAFGADYGHLYSPPCGDIHNISSPFGLKGDPKHCSGRKYTLSCENNPTLLYFFFFVFLMNQAFSFKQTANTNKSLTRPIKNNKAQKTALHQNREN